MYKRHTEKGGSWTRPGTGEVVDPPGEKKSKRKKSERKKLAHRFIRGPLSVEWMRRAGKTRAGAMVGIALYYHHGLEQTMTFKIQPSKMRQLGIGPHPQWQGLAHLEAEGLVSVEHKGRGASPIVTLLELDPEPEEEK